MGESPVEGRVQVSGHIIRELRDVHCSCPVLLQLSERDPFIWQSANADFIKKKNQTRSLVMIMVNWSMINQGKMTQN